MPRVHDWEKIRAFGFLDQGENGSRYTLVDGGVHLIWKPCHSWGNVIDTDADRLRKPDAGCRRRNWATTRGCPRGRIHSGRGGGGSGHVLSGPLRPVRGAMEMS